MTQSALIEITISTLSKLPEDKIAEVADFAEYVLKKHEESILQAGITKLINDSETFEFLAEEEDLYTVDDLKIHFK